MEKLPRVFWAGDSTVAYNGAATYPQAGLGQGIRPFLREEIEIENHAVNGRSTKSFLDEGRLKPIYDHLSEGDFLWIQFGHNDEKQEDPSRFTTPYGAYQENLGQFILAARDKKARPLLITPLYRRRFREDGALDPSMHREYRLAMMQTARDLQVPCVDLCEASRSLLERTPPEESAHWFMNLEKGAFPNYPDGKQDNTHLQQQGAAVFGGLLAAGLRALGGVYRDLLADPDAPDDSFRGKIIAGK